MNDRRPSLTPWAGGLAALAAWISAAPQSGAQTPASRPGDGHRAVATSFEPNPELPAELPPGFYRLLSRESGRPGLPPFGRVQASDRHCADGGWSLEFTLVGGAMCVATEPTLVSAAAGETFEASVLVLAPALERSEARLVLRALDPRGMPISGAEWRAVARGANGWQRLTVTSGAMPPATRSLEVALEVRPREEAGKREPSGSGASGDAGDSGDLAGAVFFDLLDVWRVPGIELGVDRGGAPIGAPPRRLTVAISDPAGGSKASGRLVDADGREILHWLESDERAFAIDCPALGPGAYELEVLVEGDDRVLARNRCAIAVADVGSDARTSAGSTASTPAALTTAESATETLPLVRFGLWIDRPPAGAHVRLMQSLRVVRPDFVVFDVGDPSTAADDLMSLEECRRFIDDLRLEGIEPVLRLSRLPLEAAVKEHLEIGDTAAIFATSGDSWRTALEPWFERFGHVVRRWMIPGSDGAPIAARLDGLVPGFLECEKSVRVIDATSTGRRADADSATLAAIDAWRDGAEMIALRGAIGPEPGAAALALGSLASSARGASSTADLEAGRELGCRLLSCGGAARVLVWRRDGGAPSRITLPFDGDAMSARDALGAPVPLERSRGAVSAEIGSSPVVIDGVDATLGAFLAALRFDPATLEGSTAEQPLTLSITNPWSVTWEGTLRFVAPVEWSFIPRLKRVSLPPGASTTVTVQTALPRSQVTGTTAVGVELEFTADRGYSLRVDPVLSIDVRDFACDASMRALTLADGRAGALVEVSLTNRSSRALELEATVSTTSGLVKRDGPVRIEPGATAKRSVRLDEPPSGAVVVTVSQTNGPQRLVRTVRE